MFFTNFNSHELFCFDKMFWNIRIFRKLPKNWENWKWRQMRVRTPLVASCEVILEGFGPAQGSVEEETDFQFRAEFNRKRPFWDGMEHKPQDFSWWRWSWRVSGSWLSSGNYRRTERIGCDVRWGSELRSSQAAKLDWRVSDLLKVNLVLALYTLWIT